MISPACCAAVSVLQHPRVCIFELRGRREEWEGEEHTQMFYCIAWAAAFMLADFACVPVISYACTNVHAWLDTHGFWPVPQGYHELICNSSVLLLIAKNHNPPESLNDHASLKSE